MIPKIIHYVWVGNQEKPELVLKCIESWKKYCPDYQIIEWNNESLKQIDNLYVSQAFENKKWAFVSDYLRLYALNKHGGIYCDTDLEITQNIDKFLENDFFIGHEMYHNNPSYQTALIGATAHNQIIADLLEEYKNIPFIVNNKLDQTPNPIRFANYFKKRFNITDVTAHQEITLTSKEKIYPYYYFCTPCHDKNNYSIHHFNGSWIDKYSRKTKLSIGKFSLIQIKRKKTVLTEKLPIKDNEKILFSFPIRKNKKLYLIKEEK